MLGLGVMGAASACTELADTSDRAADRLSSGDAAAAVPPPDSAVVLPPLAGPWACTLGTKPVVTIPPPANKKVRYRVVIVDFLGSVIQDFKIVGCKTGDVRCESPIEAVTTAYPKAPSYQIELPYQFDGYLRITANNYITTEYSLGGALIGSPDGKVDEDGTPVVMGSPIGIPSLPQLDDFYSGRAGGAVRDPKRGLLAARTIDCTGARAARANMSIVPDPKGIAYTLLSNLPVFSDPPAGPYPTDIRGVVGYVNMIPGNYRITGILPDNISMPRESAPDLARMYGERFVRINPDTLTLAEIRTDEGYLVGR